MTTAYGIDVKEHNDPYLEVSEHAAECVRLTLVPGAYLVDLLPFRGDLFARFYHSRRLI